MVLYYCNLLHTANTKISGFISCPLQPTIEQMKNIIIFLIIAILAAAGYQYYQAEYGAYHTYKKFATTLFNGKWAAAQAMTTGTKAPAQFKVVESIYKRYYGNFRESPLGPKYVLLSKAKLMKGKQVNLTLTQTVRADLGGSVSIGGTGDITFKHTASMVLQGAQWKVQSMTCTYQPPRGR